jgi:hypothetical protein
MYELLTRLPGRRMVGSLAATTALLAVVFMTLAPAVAAAGGGGKAVHPARAAAAAKTGTSIKIEVPTGTIIGKDVTVIAVLRSRSGAPLAGEHLSLWVDNASLRSDKTDAQGSISFVIPGKKLGEARDYPIRVVYSGSHTLLASSATDTLTVLEAAIQIQTVPPLPNLRFTLGTESGLTGVDGVAALPVPKSGTYQLTADLNPDTSGTATVKASFVRWIDNVYVANRTIDVTGPATYTMGIRVAYRASIKYVDLNNQPVDPTLVQQAQFSTGTGTDDVVLNSQTGANEVWWTASSTTRVSTSLLPTAVTYRALSVKIHGAEVVNRGQQAWTPTQNGVWTIQLLLYGMTVQTRDALFGTPVSGNLKLTYPDGVVVQQHVDSSGLVSFTNLPRGQYQLQLSPSAFSPPTPVALSKPQDAKIRVITYLDIALVAGVLIFAVVLLFVIGRWTAIRRRIRRMRATAAVDSDEAAIDPDSAAIEPNPGAIEPASAASEPASAAAEPAS